MALGRRKKVLFAAFTGVAFLGLLELALGLAGVDPLASRTDPSHGFSGLVPVFEHEGQRYRTRGSARGSTFNDQSFAAVKPENGFRVFCLGGSSAYGFPWGARAAFCGVLGDVLAAAHPDRVVEVVNAAGMSYGMHRVSLVAREVLEHEPDLVVVYGGHNEFVEPSYYGQIRGRGPAGNALAVALAQLRVYSAARSLVARAQSARPPPRPSDLEVRRWNRIGVYSAGDKRRIADEFAATLRGVVRRCRERGVPVVLATVPCNLRDWRPERSVTNAELTDSERRAWIEDLSAARAELAEGRFQQAADRLARARDLATDHAETAYLLGQAHEGLGHWEAAREAYAAACDLDASPVRRLSAFNAAIRRIAAEESAILVDADRIFAEASEHGLVGFNLIEDYVHPTLRGHELIAWHVWEAIERAGIVGAPGRGLRAEREWFDRVVSARPPATQQGTAPFSYNQAIVLQQQGRHAEAMAKYRETLRADPSYVAAMVNLARLLATAGERDEAERLVDAALALQPDDADARIVRGALHGDRGAWDLAMEEYRKASALDPANPQALVGLGTVAARSGDLAQAADWFARALALEPSHAEANHNLATILLAQHRPHEALEYLERALETRPDHADAHHNLGVAYLELQRTAEAVRHLRRAVEIRPDDVSFRYNLGLALLRRNEVAEARACFERILDLAPDHAEARRALESLRGRERPPDGADGRRSENEG